METYLKDLDEHFCSVYCDYVRLSALDGYRMPDMIVIESNGSIGRKDEKQMRLCCQENKEEILAGFKRDLEDIYFTFGFRYPGFFRRLKDRFSKYTFSKILPSVLSHSGETVESAGKKLSLDPKIWQGIVKGDFYPEKNTVLALALVCRLSVEDVNALFTLCDFQMDNQNVRDVVVGYLIQQKIFNPMMRDRCLAEYRIFSLPIAANPENA